MNDYGQEYYAPPPPAAMDQRKLDQLYWSIQDLIEELRNHRYERRRRQRPYIPKRRHYPERERRERLEENNKPMSPEYEPSER